MKSVAASQKRIISQKKPALAKAMMRDRRSRNSMKIAATIKALVVAMASAIGVLKAPSDW